jgi:hypothetical protein
MVSLGRILVGSTIQRCDFQTIAGSNRASRLKAFDKPGNTWLSLFSLSTKLKTVLPGDKLKKAVSKYMCGAYQNESPSCEFDKKM